jgi:hypothetical protein
MRDANMMEKRKHKRLDVTLPVILRYGGRLIPATMLNLSCGGTRIRAEQTGFSENAPVELIFDLDNQTYDLSMRGNISHSAKDPTSQTSCFAGIQFASTVSDSHKALEEYLTKHG